MLLSRISSALHQKLKLHVSIPIIKAFTPKINHYKDSSQPFAKNVLSFLLFAHRCEIIGVTPEMVFRIADKSRDKKVGVGSFS